MNPSWLFVNERYREVFSGQKPVNVEAAVTFLPSTTNFKSKSTRASTPWAALIVHKFGGETVSPLRTRNIWAEKLEKFIHLIPKQLVVAL